MAYTISVTTRFKKQYKKCLKQGLPEEAFMTVLHLLAQTGTLPPEYHAHNLSGNYAGCMECHIKPDWLLIWQQNDTELKLLLIATGSHSELFGKTRR